MAYAILFFLWIIVPKLTTEEFSHSTVIMENHLYQVIFAIPVCLYYARLLHFGFFKKLYEAQAQILISGIWTMVFGFLKISEISMNSHFLQSADFIVQFEELFDLIFAVSYPVAVACINLTVIFFKNTGAPRLSHFQNGRVTEPEPMHMALANSDND